MKVQAMKVKLFGMFDVLYRVLNDAGEVLQVCETKEEAEAWIAAH